MKFPRDNVSSSLINAYKDCPRGFYLTVVEELMVEEGPALEIGSILDYMFKKYHEGEDWLNKSKEKFFKDKFPKQRIKNFAEAQKLMEVYLKDPDVFVKPTFDIMFNIPIVHPTTNEVIPNITLKGYLDGYDNGRIKELKSTTQPYTQEKVDEAIQATIYCYGKYATDGEIYPIDYIVLGKKTMSVDRFTTTRTKEDFNNLFETIKQFIKDVEDEKFDRNPNHPYFCPCRKL